MCLLSVSVLTLLKYIFVWLWFCFCEFSIKISKSIVALVHLNLWSFPDLILYPWSCVRNWLPWSRQWPLTMSPDTGIIRCLLCGLGTLESSLELHLKYNHLIYQEPLLKVSIVWKSLFKILIRSYCSFFTSSTILLSARKLSQMRLRLARTLWMTKMCFQMLPCLHSAHQRIKEV